MSHRDRDARSRTRFRARRAVSADANAQGRLAQLMERVVARYHHSPSAYSPTFGYRSGPETRKAPQMRGFPEAAEGIRTLDHLHGKQNVRRRFHMNMPANRAFPRVRTRGRVPGFPRETTGVWVVNG